MIRSARGRLLATLISFAGAAIVAGCDNPADPAKGGPGSSALPEPGPPDASRGSAIKRDAAELRKDIGDKAIEIKKEAGEKATELKKEAGEAAKKIEEKGSELKKEAGAEIKKGEEAVGKGLENLGKKLEGQPK